MRPTAADTSPSWIWPSRDSVVSSQCSAMRRPVTAPYWSARRIRPGDETGTPSSLKPAAPPVASSAISVSSAPRCPLVIDARKPTGISASARAVSTSEPSIAAESTTGSVFGMARIAQYPPAAAAAVPLAIVSSSSRPGVRRWTCGSTNAGASSRLSPWSTRWAFVSRSVPSATITPSSTRTSRIASTPASGSTTRALRTTRFSFGAAFAYSITPPPAVIRP